MTTEIVHQEAVRAEKADALLSAAKAMLDAPPSERADARERLAMAVAAFDAPAVTSQAPWTILVRYVDEQGRCGIYQHGAFDSESAAQKHASLFDWTKLGGRDHVVDIACRRCSEADWSIVSRAPCPHRSAPDAPPTEPQEEPSDADIFALFDARFSFTAPECITRRYVDEMTSGWHPPAHRVASARLEGLSEDARADVIDRWIAKVKP